jgi:hypothetical protein
VHDLLGLYVHFGVDPAVRVGNFEAAPLARSKGAMRRAFDKLFGKR